MNFLVAQFVVALYEYIITIVDLSTHISRQEFEELCGDLFERVRGCLSELIMKVPDLDLADLHSVEVIGGSSRIPKFKNIIGIQYTKEFWPDRIRAVICTPNYLLI